MAVTANQLISRQDGKKQSHKVAGSTRLYQGTLAFLTALGYLADVIASGANKFAGIVVDEANNASGSAGDIEGEVFKTGVYKLVGSGFTQADEGRDVYATDNYTINVGAAVGVLIGRVERYVSATELMVRINVDQQGDKVYSSTAASANITNTTDVTAFDKSVSIPANRLRVGDVIRVRAQAIAPTTNSSDTLNLKLLLGSVEICATGAVNVADGDIGYIEADIVIRTIGASGTLVAAGATALGVPGTVTAKPFLKASATIDTTAANTISVTATWSVASTSNITRLDVLNVQILRAQTP